MLNPSRYRTLYAPFSRVRHPRLGHRPRDSHRPCGLYGDRAYRALLALEETIIQQQANQGNQRALTARERRSRARRFTSAMASRPAMAALRPLVLRSPKLKTSEASKVLMGELKLPEPAGVSPTLEAALERWKKAAEGQGLLGSG